MSFRKDIKIAYLHDNSEERNSARQVDMISQCILYFIVLLCFLISTEGAFAAMFKQVNGEVIPSHTATIMLLLFPIIPFMKLAGDTENKKTAWAVRCAVAGFYIVCTGLFVLSQEEKFLNGFGHIRWCVCSAINNYYKLNIIVDRGISADCGFAVSLSLFVLFAVILYFAILAETRMILLVAPILSYALLMSVGYAPDKKGMLCMTVGVLLSGSSSWEKYQTASGKHKSRRKLANLVLTVILAMIIPFFNSSALKGKAEKLVDEVSPDVKQFQRSIDEKIQEKYEKKIQDLTEKYEGQEKESITNRKPRYNEEPMLSVTINEKPENNLYLREFYGMEYASGSWNSHFDRLEAFEASEGIQKGQLTKWLVEKLNQRAGCVGNGMIWVSGEIDYEKKLKQVFIPHIYNITNAGIDYVGEYIAGRKKSDATIDFAGYDIDLYDILNNPNLSRAANVTYKYEYESYVAENYMSGCDGVPTARLIANRIMPYVNTGVTGYGEAYNNNVYRIYSALLVAEYLSSAEYSLDLKGSTGGTDNVEFFLSDSQKGFCIHFASAGTLILQYMGVPARYASGYIASTADFKQNGTEYTAELLDSSAHAWTEIYLDNIGWIPIEMTTGYSNGNTSYANTMADFKTISDDPVINKNLTNQTTEKDRTEQTTSTTEKATTEKAHVTTENEPASVESSVSATEKKEELEKTDEARTKSGGKKDKNVYVVVIALLLFATLAAAFVVKSGSYSEKKVRRLLKTDVKKALFCVNETIVGNLRRKKHIFKRNLSDAEYIRFLTELVPTEEEGSVRKYVRIIQKARFSNHEISVDDVEFCMALCYTKRKNKRMR